MTTPNYADVKFGGYIQDMLANEYGIRQIS